MTFEEENIDTSLRDATFSMPTAPSRPLIGGRNPGDKPIDLRSQPKLMAPTYVDLDVTENCNLGCGYCFKGDKYSQSMSIETAKKSIEWLFQASQSAIDVHVNFMGGEPTIRWKIISDLVPWARRRGRSMGKRVHFSMTSNLTLWTEEIRSFVDDWGFGVLMSIDGCPEVQDAQRPAKNGKSMASTVEYWAKSLLRTRPYATARSTFEPKWIHKFHESMVYLHSIGFREVAVSGSEYEHWNPQEMAALQKQVDLTVSYIIEVFRAGSEFNLSIFKSFLREIIIPHSSGAPVVVRRQPCGAGRGMMMIDYTGDIWPCHRFDGADEDSQARGQFRMGNIFEAGFNHDLQRVFLSFDHTKMHKDSCSACPANPICGGYCPAANISTTGSLYTPPDAYCYWMQVMYSGAYALHQTMQADQVLRNRVLATIDSPMDNLPQI